MDEKTKKWQHTLWIGKHTHQRRQLRWTAAVGNVQPSAGRTRHAARGRGRLLLLLLLLLLLIHDGQRKGGRAHCRVLVMR